ncbi:MAG: S-layer homology domain-containing protein [Clostridiales Family XIII bacterium]|jgi:hypothetical protein|nr:S-layer homology domain-containing protein [Clostridiales Family XIII bacterium]
MKKIVSWIAITTMAAALFVSGAASQPSYAAASFPDIAGHWAEGEVMSATNHGYINGYVDGTFRPDNPISRAEFVKIINTAMYYTEMTNIAYKDVPVNEWYFYEVQKAQRAGYIQGDDSGLFRPDAQITREETAVILGRISDEGDSNFSLTGVRDVSRVSDWAMEGVRRAYSLGYMNGDTNANFNPAAPLRRGEAVKIINRVIGLQPMDVSSGSGTGQNGNQNNNNNNDNQNNNNSTAPSVSSVNISSITQSQATLTFTVSKDATLYWVVLLGDGSSTPNATQITQGRTNGNSSAYSYSSRTVYANSSSSATLSSLDADQSYKVCLVAKDSNGVFSPIATRTFTTSASGSTGENWLSTFSVGSITNDSIKLTARSTRRGYVYWVIVEGSSSSTPSASRIRDGRDASNNYVDHSDSFSVSANSSESMDIYDLTPGTNYRIYGCVFDGTSSNSNYSVVKSASFKTTGTNNQWISRLNVPTADIQETSARFTSTFSVSGSSYRFYWMAVKNSNPTPTPAQIKAASYGGSSTATNTYNPNIVDFGDGSGYSVPSSRSLSYDVNNLVAGETYAVYGVVYSGSSTYSNVVKSNTFKADSQVAYATNLTAMSLSYKDGGGSTKPLESGKFSFAPGTYTYNVALPAGSTEMSLSVTTAALATARHNGNVFANFGATGSISVPLGTGTTQVDITVRESGKTDRVYRLNVSVEAAPTAEINSISIQDLQPEFSFSKGTYEYHHTVASGTSSVPVLVNAASGVNVNVTSTGPSPPSSSSEGSYMVQLNAPSADTAGSGVTVITISASKAGADDVEYRITITRP